jgi:sodium transport system permease protein
LFILIKGTALISGIINGQVLATKELIAGTLDFGLVALSFTVMLTLAIVAVIVSYKRFDKETNVVM